MSASTFPRLLVFPDRVVAAGTFAEAQADFLEPDRTAVDELDALLQEHRIGIVAHFYMDPELQGVLSACKWPHVQISDSLKMSDSAVEMARQGLRAVVVLGVDFMAENVRAVLDASGHESLPVYRVASDPIGCSLAEAAETTAYESWLDEASRIPRSLHVVYINTSLRTKAAAHRRVPTITCTSSNVLQTVLQAAAQIEDVRIWFGPDTYMGANLVNLLGSIAGMTDDEIHSIHPDHSQSSIRSLLSRFDYYRQGACVVHHMFGEQVAEAVRTDHADAFITAHLEVPGAMFDVALEAQRQGRGVVGSTSNILSFISDTVAKAEPSQRLSFVLGTEAGMITSIVREVRRQLKSLSSPPEVQIVFPVASEAVTRTHDPELALVPGVAGGEGCSVEGGCATCPFMKMNSLDALLRTVAQIGRVSVGSSGNGSLGADSQDLLSSLEPKKYGGSQDNDDTVAADATTSISHMRYFQRHGRLSDELVSDVARRNAH